MERPFDDHQPLSGLPLHTVTERFNTSGLYGRFTIEISEFDEDTQQKLKDALSFATKLHSKDRRSTEPALNHLLRTCIRAKEHYEIKNPEILAALLLHDTVEDHATDIIGSDLGDYTQNKEAALAIIADIFSPRVSRLVEGVTNPEFDPNKDKIEQYLEHLEDLVKNGEPEMVIIKLSDFTDNGAGLRYSKGPKVPHWAKKYLAALPILVKGASRSDLPISEETRTYIHDRLERTRLRLEEISSQNKAA